MPQFREGNQDKSSHDASVRMLSNAISKQDFESAGYIVMNYRDSKGKAAPAKWMLQTVLHRCAKLGDVVGTTWCATKLSCLGIQPNASAYNAILAACSKSGNLSMALAWWEKMITEGVSPNNISYNTMIHTCAQAGDLPSAVYWMTELLNSDVEPCKISFAAIISSFAKVGYVNEAEMWYQKMVELKILPDTVIFNTLIGACAKGGKLSRAEYWLTQMEASKLYPDQKTYNNLINIAAKAGSLEKALSLYQSMLHSGEVPDMYTFGSILNACANVADLDSAEDIMKEIQKRVLEPNLVCYNTIITCCAKCNDADKAMFWYDRLRRQGLVGKKNTFNSLLLACVNADRKDVIEKVLENMILSGVSPDRSNVLKLASLVDKRSPLGSEWPYFIVLKACIRAQSCAELKRWLSQISSPKTLSDTFVRDLNACADAVGGSSKVRAIIRSCLPPRQGLHAGTMKNYREADNYFGVNPYVQEELSYSKETMKQSLSMYGDDAQYQKVNLTETNMCQHEKKLSLADSQIRPKYGLVYVGAENYSIPLTNLHDLEQFPDSNPCAQVENFNDPEMVNARLSLCDDDAHYQKVELTETRMCEHEKKTSPEFYSFASTDLYDLEPGSKSSASSLTPSNSELPLGDHLTLLAQIGLPPGLELPAGAVEAR